MGIGLGLIDQTHRTVDKMYGHTSKNKTILVAPRTFNQLAGVLCLLILSLLFVSCAERPVFREEAFYPKIKRPVVTVKLLETTGGLTVSSEESFAIRCSPVQGEPSVYYATGEIEVKFSPDGITLFQKTQGSLEASLRKVSFFPKKGKSWLCVNGKPYRGVIEVTPSRKAKALLALNVIHVEDYLEGVVKAEIGKLSRLEIEALKAQAVAARTYALSRTGQHADEGYDLEATVDDQVYSGVEGEYPLADQAIKLTKGRVLTYQGRLVCAYYHASCGGETEYIEKVWDKPAEPYLVPANDTGFCSWSKSFRWEESWTKDVLKRNIQEFLDTVQPPVAGEFGDLLDLRIKERSPSGRVEVLEVVTDTGIYPIRADKIRWALKRGDDSNSILPSTWFDLDIQRAGDGSIQKIVARGQGNGHGVGMCQSGAIGMARNGYSYKDILLHYYPGAKITKCY